MDSFDAQARLSPAILTISPCLLAALQGVRYIQAPLWLTGIVGTAAIAAILKLLVQFTRTEGKKVEARLYSQWGGKPTTAMLRHSDTRLNQYTKQNYHTTFNSLGLGISAPTVAEEQADPCNADARYEAFMDEIRRRAKAAKVKAVHRENISYNFMRNLYALKSFGIFISLVSLAYLSITELIRIRAELTLLDPAIIILTMICSFSIFAWIFLVTDKLVRRQAEAYALELFETIN